MLTKTLAATRTMKTRPALATLAEVKKKYPSAANGGMSVGRTKAQSLIASRMSAVKKRK